MTTPDSVECRRDPGLMEFYADWCTSCQLMTEDLAALRDTDGDRLSFVMLNVDKLQMATRNDD